MGSPSDRRYLSSHEWHKLEGDEVVIGISQFAVDELTDITFLEVSADGEISAGDQFGEIESVKATSELYIGIGGQVTAVNQEVIDNPEIINQDPYGKGWMLRIKPSNPSELDSLLDAGAYDAQAH